MANATESLAAARYVSLATFRRDGTEVRTPVWIAAAEGAAVIYTNATSWKVKRIRNNGKVRLAPCTARGDIRGDWVDATARIVEHDAGQNPVMLRGQKVERAELGEGETFSIGKVEIMPQSTANVSA